MTSKFAVVIEKGEGSYSAYVPDLPGCIAAADTVAAVKRLIREAIAFHIEGMMLDGDPVPEATSLCCYVLAKVDKSARQIRRERRRSSD